MRYSKILIIISLVGLILSSDWKSLEESLVLDDPIK